MIPCELTVPSMDSQLCQKILTFASIVLIMAILRWWSGFGSAIARLPKLRRFFADYTMT